MINLSENDKVFLLKTARNALNNYLKYFTESEKKRSGDESVNLLFQSGAFVTLYNKGELRGCVGQMESTETITKLVEKMAIAASAHDHRFKSVTRKELEDICIEISILTPKRKIDTIEEFDPAKHGIYIIKGNQSGTFLPQVAKETGWDKEELLGRCSRDKAGLGWDEWENADLYVYEVINFSEDDFDS
jgi:hypothetical protein